MNDNIMYDALIAQFEAQRLSAVATLSIYFNNPAGIGEHPQHIEEMMKLTRTLAEADNCIKTLNATFLQDSVDVQLND